MNFIVNFVFKQHSIQGQKVIETLKNVYINENQNRKNPKNRVENRHEAKQVDEENDSNDIPNDGMTEDNHYSDISNAGGFYGHVLSVEMM